MRIKYGGIGGCECWAYTVAWLLSASTKPGYGGHYIWS